MTNSSESIDVMPRSEILELLERSAGKTSLPITTPGDVEQIAAKAGKLADLAGVLPELHALRERMLQTQSYGASERLNTVLNAMASLDKAYREFEAGFPTSLEAGIRSSDQGAVNLLPLQTEFLLLVLPRYLHLPIDLKPEPNESVDAFLTRTEKSARDRSELALVVRTRDARRAISRGGFSWNELALQSYISAQNQEAAGQYMLAVISYQQALRNGTEDVPARTIGEKLDALKAAHPDEFEKGMTQFLAPRDNDWTPRMDPSPQPQAGRSPSLIVPGKTPPAVSPPSASPKPTRKR